MVIPHQSGSGVCPAYQFYRWAVGSLRLGLRKPDEPLRRSRHDPRQHARERREVGRMPAAGFTLNLNTSSAVQSGSHTFSDRALSAAATTSIAFKRSSCALMTNSMRSKARAIGRVLPSALALFDGLDGASEGY